MSKLFRGGLLPAIRAAGETAGISPRLNEFESCPVSWVRDMKSLTEVIVSLLLALVLLRASGSLVGIIYEWKLRAGKF